MDSNKVIPLAAKCLTFTSRAYFNNETYKFMLNDIYNLFKYVDEYLKPKETPLSKNEYAIYNSFYFVLKQRIISKYEKLYDQGLIDKKFKRKYETIDEYESAIILNSLMNERSNRLFLNLNQVLDEDVYPDATFEINKLIGEKNVFDFDTDDDILEILTRYFDMLQLLNISLKNSLYYDSFALFLMDEQVMKINELAYDIKNGDSIFKPNVFPGIFDIFHNLTSDKKPIFNYIMSEEFINKLYNFIREDINIKLSPKNYYVNYATIRMINRLIENDVYEAFVREDKTSFKNIDEFISLIEDTMESSIEDYITYEDDCAIDNLINDIRDGLIDLDNYSK